jgi:hypothetical protein
MKNYTIEAKDDAEHQKIENIIMRIGLKKKLQIKHKQTGTGCPLEVSHVVKYGGGNPTHFQDSLTINIDETEPKLMANDCQWGYVDENRMASFVFDGVFVMIQFNNHEFEDEIDTHWFSETHYGFQQLAYMASVANLTLGEITVIIGEEKNKFYVEEALKTGVVSCTAQLSPTTLFDKLYELRSLFTKLLNLSRYKKSAFKQQLADTSEFKQCIVPPPWYPDNVIEYIKKSKMLGVKAAVQWLYTY